MKFITNFLKKRRKAKLIKELACLKVQSVKIFCPAPLIRGAFTFYTYHFTYKYFITLILPCIIHHLTLVHLKMLLEEYQHFLFVSFSFYLFFVFLIIFSLASTSFLIAEIVSRANTFPPITA